MTLLSDIVTLCCNMSMTEWITVTHKCACDWEVRVQYLVWQNLLHCCNFCASHFACFCVEKSKILKSLHTSLLGRDPPSDDDSESEFEEEAQMQVPLPVNGLTIPQYLLSDTHARSYRYVVIDIVGLELKK